MMTFIIICFAALAIEAGRLYFVLSKYYPETPKWDEYFSSICFVALMIGSYYIRAWELSLELLIISIFVPLILKLLVGSDVLNNRRGKEIASYFCSWLVPLVVVIVVTAVTVSQDNKAFETKWQNTSLITINCQPIKAVVNGNETVVLECVELSEDISFSVDKYGFDVLKLEEMDEIKYLKEGERENFEIITLRGQAYLGQAYKKKN